MSFPRLIPSLALVAVMAATAAAQDVVRLKNGRVLNGTIVLDGDLKVGFTLKRWDTDGAVFIRWTQIPDAEAYRLRTRISGTSEDASGVDLIDAVRIVTSGQRELVGVIVAERDDRIEIKTREGTQATPRAAVVHREAVKVKESDVYTPDEMVDRRAKGVADTDFTKLMELGHFASTVRVYLRSKDFFTKAAAVAPPDRADEVKTLLTALDVKIVEDKAEKALAAVWKLANELKFNEAIDAANKFLTEYPETSSAKANPKLLTDLEGRRKEFETNRAKVLAQAVPDQWRLVRQAQLTKLVAGKLTLVQVRDAIAKIDDEVLVEVAKKLNATKEEVNKHWDERTEKKIRKVSLGDGTWVYKGGQDGGMDYSGSAEEDPLEDIRKRYGDQDPKKKPPELGRKLETSQEWWQSASTSVRKEWSECYYAATSARVKKEEEQEVDCRPCRGQGKRQAVRGTKTVEVICAECHGVKKTLTIKYW
jgi:hypothetical protein